MLVNVADQVIIGIDVGSVRRKGGFAWATADGLNHGQNDPSELGAFVIKLLEAGDQVALACECPLSVPVPEVDATGWASLGLARQGEGNRAWSAGAGTGALATGLVQVSWVLRYIVRNTQTSYRATTQASTFLTRAAPLLVVEAMVTSDGKPQPVDGLQDHADALAAARRLQEILAENHVDGIASDVSCHPHSALNLAAVAAMHAGMDIDPGELHCEVLVAKSRPVI